MKNKNIFFVLLFILLLACNIPGGEVVTESPLITIVPSALPIATGATDVPVEPPPTVAIIHTQTPSISANSGALVYDVESSGTAQERRAPYGDSYNINRMERPFLQDMTYVSDLDIVTYSVSQDDTWFYVSIKLIGNDPNNSLGINYGVEIDIDHDGFGDYIIWAQPPYTPAWDTANVKIFTDKNHNTAGLSGDKSDAPLNTDGYETQIFNGGTGDVDPDMAWIRANAGVNATLQFAFKKSWSGAVFMLGVIADAGLKDVTKLDYVDRFKEEDAGSPVKDKKYYPLKALFAVDNTCQEAFGFQPQGYESKLCPRTPLTPAPGKPPVTCLEPGQYSDKGACEAGGCLWKYEPNQLFYFCAYP